jgi:hypothetical protein
MNNAGHWTSEMESGPSPVLWLGPADWMSPYQDRWQGLGGPGWHLVPELGGAMTVRSAPRRRPGGSARAAAGCAS